MSDIPAPAQGPTLPPVPLTAFIGRDQEVTTVTALLLRQDVRLLTLTGPGGIGKTRVAIAAARKVEDHFPDGVAFVSFAALTDPQLVLATVAQAFGVPEAPNVPMSTRLQAFLRPRRILLVLDNLEHLLDASAAMVADLLSHAPHITMLCTSRVRLAVSGEQLFPLDVLGPEAAQTLFISRVQALQPGFSFTPKTTPVVKEICRRLDRLPLAIELAAARVSVLALGELLARLERRLPLLIGGDRDAPARQRTMRSTVAWSYDLLSSAEQRLFRQLGVFSGGFTLSAATAIAGNGDADAVLNGVTALTTASLIRLVDVSGSESRFEMLETIREYALEQLVACGEDEEMQHAYARHYASLAIPFRHDLEGPRRVVALDTMTRELDNVRAVLAWAIEHQEAEIAQHLAGNLGPFWMDRGLLREAKGWLEPALRLPGAGSASRAEALYWAGGFALWQQDDLRAERYGEEALSLAQQDGNDLGGASALNLLAAVAETRHQPDLARKRYEEALRWLQGLTEPAWAPAYAPLILDSLGNMAMRQGDLVTAATWYEDALNRWRQLDHPWGIPLTLGNLAEVARRQGDISMALELELESLTRHWAQGDYFHIASNLCGIADVLLLVGRAAEAARLVAAASTQFAIIGMVNLPGDQTRFDDLAEQARRELDTHAFGAAWAAGEALPLADAVAEALEVALARPMRNQPSSTCKHGLSPREQEVLRLIAAGRSNAQIAEVLCISSRTVTTHASHILGKLGLSTRAEVIAFAHREGLA